jgi:hypothetical protein
VFVELKRTGKKGQKKKAKSVPYFVTHGEIVRMPRQIFGANPSVQEMDQLVTAWPDRTFSLGSRRVTFVLCGQSERHGEAQ